MSSIHPQPTYPVAESQLNEPSSVIRGAFLGRHFEPVDIASLDFFRIAFGAIMIWEVGYYFSRGWIQKYFIDSTYHFSYYGFG